MFEIQNFIPFWKDGGPTKGPEKFPGDLWPPVDPPLGCIVD